MPNVCRLLLVEKSNGLTSVRKDERMRNLNKVFYFSKGDNLFRKKTTLHYYNITLLR